MTMLPTYPPRCLALLVLALLAGPAWAQVPDPAPDRLGVYDAIELARQYNPVLGEGRARVARTQAAWWTGLGLAPPEVTYFREGIPEGAGDGFAEQRWTLTQRIDFPLTTYYRLQRYGAEEGAAALDLAAVQARLRGDVKKAYTDLLYAQELVHLRQEEVALGRQLVDAAAVRVEVGEASELEAIKAEIGLAEAQSGLAAAQQQFQNARYHLFRVVGLDPEAQRYEVDFPDTLAYVDAAIDQTAVMARIDRQPALRGAARQLDAARSGVRQARSALLPDLAFDLYAQDYGTGFDQRGFQIGLSVPLWFAADLRGRVRAARADVQAQAWRHEAVALDLKQEAERAWHGYETSKETIDRYRTAVQARADELLQRTVEGYRLGEIDLLTLLDTQRTYLASQQRYYDALRTYYHHLIDLERFLDADLVFAPDAAPVQAALDR